MYLRDFPSSGDLTCTKLIYIYFRFLVEWFLKEHIFVVSGEPRHATHFDEDAISPMERLQTKPKQLFKTVKSVICRLVSE